MEHLSEFDKEEAIKFLREALALAEAGDLKALCLVQVTNAKTSAVTMVSAPLYRHTLECGVSAAHRRIGRINDGLAA